MVKRRGKVENEIKKTGMRWRKRRGREKGEGRNEKKRAEIDEKKDRALRSRRGVQRVLLRLGVWGVRSRVPDTQYTP